MATCECGCGGHVGRDKRGRKQRFVLGHQSYKPLDTRYRVEDRGYSTPCWVWFTSRASNGYGQISERRTKRSLYAHRVMWERDHGPIPDGLQLHHLCAVRACVNPDHMEMRSPGDHRKAHWVELCDELLALTVDDGAEIRRLGVDRPRDEKE
jgi:hypothetical protein